MHEEKHPLAGQTVILNLKGKHPHIPESDEPIEYRLEDWWDKVSGGSWMNATGNPAALMYAGRSGIADLPLDDEVVYGKVGSFGHLIHVSELGELVPKNND